MMWVEDDGGLLVNLGALEVIYPNARRTAGGGETCWVEATRNYASEKQEGVKLCMVRDECEAWDVIAAIGQAIGAGKPLLSLPDLLPVLRGETE